MDPQVMEQRCLEYDTPNYFGQWTPNMKLLVVDNQLAHDLLKIYVFNKSPFDTVIES